MENLRKLYGAPVPKPSEYLTHQEALKKVKKKKRKVKEVTSTDGGAPAPAKLNRKAITIVDHDVLNSVAPVSDNEASDEEDKPVVVEDLNLKSMSEYQLKLKRAQDQRSGWVEISQQTQADPGRDLSPPRRVKDFSPNQIKTDGDNSPPRRNRSDSSPPRRNRGDTSPPRRNRKDPSPPRKSTKATESPPRRNRKDPSPPRKSKGDASPSRRRMDSSPPRKSKGDASPPRRRMDSSPPRKSKGDSSPPRKGKGDSSPPRKSKGDVDPPRKSKGTASPPRRRDSSPPRKSKGDVSPPRRRNSPPRKSQGEVSPPRRRRDSSPPRKSQADSSPKRTESPPRRYKVSPRRAERSKEIIGPAIKEAKDTSPPPWKDLTDQEEAPSRKRGLGLAPPHENESKAKKMRVEEHNNDKAKKGGLFTAAEMEVETQKKLQEASEAKASMDPVAAGKGAETIYRDKRGRPLTMLNKMVGTTQTEEEQYEWGGGKKTTKEEDEEKKRFEEEQKGMPYRGATTEDEQLNEEYRNAVRFGDPMAELLAKKIKKREKKRMKKLGIVPKPVIPKKQYKGYCPPNRFGIKPGFEWDGIDRSNGYEKRYFERINERKAREDMEVRWAQEDL